MFIGINGNLTTTPSNEVALVNSTIRLECKAADQGSLKWTRLSEDKNIAFGTYVRPELNDIFTIDNTRQGRYDLIVRPELNDADSYQCERSETSFSAQLIVLGDRIQNLIQTEYATM